MDRAVARLFTGLSGERSKHDPATDSRHVCNCSLQSLTFDGRTRLAPLLSDVDSLHSSAAPDPIHIRMRMDPDFGCKTFSIHDIEHQNTFVGQQLAYEQNITSNDKEPYITVTLINKAAVQ